MPRNNVAIWLPHPRAGFTVAFGNVKYLSESFNLYHNGQADVGIYAARVALCKLLVALKEQGKVKEAYALLDDKTSYNIWAIRDFASNRLMQPPSSNLNKDGMIRFILTIVGFVDLPSAEEMAEYMAALAEKDKGQVGEPEESDSKVSQSDKSAHVTGSNINQPSSTSSSTRRDDSRAVHEHRHASSPAKELRPFYPEVKDGKVVLKPFVLGGSRNGTDKATKQACGTPVVKDSTKTEEGGV